MWVCKATYALALSGHPNGVLQCPLSGIKRTLRNHVLCLLLTQSGHQKAECYEGDHIGGLMPLRPTEMFDARIVPSGSFFAAAEKTFSPGLRSASVAGAKVTTATFGGTSNVFSPSLYLKTSVLLSLLATWVATVAFVIVLLGIRSQGR